MRSYGGLKKNQDKIFTNLYSDGDPLIDGTLKRGDLNSWKKHMPFWPCNFLFIHVFQEFFQG